MILPEIPAWMDGYALPNGSEPKAVATSLAVLDAVKACLRAGKLADVRLELRGDVLFVAWRHSAAQDRSISADTSEPLPKEDV